MITILEKIIDHQDNNLENLKNIGFEYTADEFFKVMLEIE